MKFLLMLLLAAASFLGVHFAWPQIETQLSLKLNKRDLLPLEPIRGTTTAIPSAPGPAAPATKLLLAKAAGKVLKLSLSSGEWNPAQANDPLAEGEQIRTEVGGMASIAQEGDKARVELTESSQLALRGATTAGHRFRLVAGFTVLRYADASLPFAVESKNGKTVVEGKADAYLLADGDRLAVSAHSGSVTVRDNGKALTVPSGSVAFAREGLLPEKALAKLPKLDLKVDPTGPLPPDDRTATITGTVTAGARVLVAGVLATVDDMGRFSAKVPLKLGDNRLTVLAQDVGGAGKKATVPSLKVAGTAKAAAAPGPAGPRKPTKPKGEGMQWGTR